ncbi:MAG TPA: hypothetical protein VNE39_04825 [Planctomycetota bacterium]|nr:hypothetical protein [Planctomycetota bacterium]
MRARVVCLALGVAMATGAWGAEREGRGCYQLILPLQGRLAGEHHGQRRAWLLGRRQRRQGVVTAEAPYTSAACKRITASALRAAHRTA